MPKDVHIVKAWPPIRGELELLGMSPVEEASPWHGCVRGCGAQTTTGVCADCASAELGGTAPERVFVVNGLRPPTRQAIKQREQEFDEAATEAEPTWEWPEGATGFLIHNRATDTLYFGPFKDWAELRAWKADHREVPNGGVNFMYLDVDWRR